MTKIMMDADCIKFFLNPPENDTAAIYKEAVRRAYGDMSRHTLRFHAIEYIGDNKYAKANRQFLRDQILALLLAEESDCFKTCSQESFDKWHKHVCEQICDIFTHPDSCGIAPICMTPKDAERKLRKDTFSYGQAQKVLNMALKYVYIFYQYFNAYDGSYDKELANFNKIIAYLHTPIDSFVTKAACDKRSKYYLGCDMPEYPWSQFSYSEYIKLQKDIRKKLSEQNESPFIWELQNYPFK